MPELTAVDWVLLATAASLVGFAKTAVGGVAGLAVAVFAFVLPARESTGAVLGLLLVGDVIAVGLYRRHAEWALLLRLLPSVVPGLVIGAWFVARADETLMQRGIALVLVGMVLIQLYSGRREFAPVTLQEHLRAVPRTAGPVAVGMIAGFATMTANSAGPVMTIYLLLAGLPVVGLLGTAAWFFFLVNLAKVPFSAGLDLMGWPVLLMDLALVPALACGAGLGALVAKRIPRTLFGSVTLVLTLAAASALLV